MTAVARAVPRGHVEQLQWLAPAPLWDEGIVGAAASGVLQPWIAELTTDAFVDDFTAIVRGTDGHSPRELKATKPATTTDGKDGSPYRLFQPLSARYYLLTATLVCRRPGIPDHAVHLDLEESTTFVIRRLGAQGEEAFVPGAGDSGRWVAAPADALVQGEEQMPMHTVPVAPFADPGTTAAALGMASGQSSQRVLHFGYVPVGSRERKVPSMADPAQRLRDLLVANPLLHSNPIVDELVQRVVQPWAALREAPAPTTIRWEAYPSLFLVLDLADWLDAHLSSVLQDILASRTPTATAAAALVAQMEQVSILRNGTAAVTLNEAVRQLNPYVALVHGSDTAGPPDTYDLRTATLPAGWLDGPSSSKSLQAVAAAALTEAKATYSVPPELEGMIKEDPVPSGAPGGNGPQYVARAVFEHPPCQPVLSSPTHPFELARALDADAPARRVRIQVPDITNLRAFNRGVALEVPPNMRRMVDRVTPKILKGDPLNPDGGLQLGMICSFSLQIIFIIAFMILIVFLLLLNIVFWWLPFFKICFPIPLPPKPPTGPSPGGQP